MKKLELSLKGTPWAQNFAVQELDAKEMREIDGGFLSIVLGILTIVGAGYAVGKKIGETAYEITH